MDLPAAAPPLTLHETARRLGAYAWIEARMFEVLGSWVPTVAEPAAKICLATHSRVHGWHAEMWADAVPDLREQPRAELVTPPAPEVATFFDALAAVGGGGTVERLTAVFRVVVPRLVGLYGAHASAASPVADGATARRLRVVAGDEAEHWREGEAVLQSLLVDSESVRRAAATQGQLEAALVAAGGLLGAR